MTVKEGKEIVCGIVDKLMSTGNEIEITGMEIKDEMMKVDVNVYKKPVISELILSMDILRNEITEDYENS